MSQTSSNLTIMNLSFMCDFPRYWINEVLVYVVDTGDLFHQGVYVGWFPSVIFVTFVNFRSRIVKYFRCYNEHWENKRCVQLVVWIRYFLLQKPKTPGFRACKKADIPQTFELLAKVSLNSCVCFLDSCVSWFNSDELSPGLGTKSNE